MWERQTVGQLAHACGRSRAWIRIKLDQAHVTYVNHHTPHPIVIIADTVFHKRTFGITVLRDAHCKINLYWQVVTSETAEAYASARRQLERQGYTLQAAVIDGRRGIQKVFADIPVQMCHFHQIAAINRYLTRRPKLPAGQELRAIALSLTHTTEAYFRNALKVWYARWQSFLKERTISPESGRWFYTHRRLRAASRSLHANLPHLFTYQACPELDIPNTTNGLDGTFSHLKDLLRVHRGLKNRRKMKLMDEVLGRHQ